MPTQHPLADILSITTGRLLSRQHMGGIYSILNDLTGDDLMTHQLPRAAEACAPVILAQHPQLAGVEPPESLDVAGLMAWLADAEQQYGVELPVAPLAGWERRNPIEELCDMIGPERVVVVDPDELLRRSEEDGAITRMLDAEAGRVDDAGV